MHTWFIISKIKNTYYRYKEDIRFCFEYKKITSVYKKGGCRTKSSCLEMMNTKNERKDLNRVRIRGEIIEPIELSHKIGEKTFWKTKIAFIRHSGVKDIIPVTLLENVTAFVGDTLSVLGEIRSISYYIDNVRQRERHIYAYDAKVLNEKEQRNKIVMEGTVIREPVYIKTEKGRDVTNLTICNGRSYIPCVCWWENALKVKDLPVGARVQLRGVIQSQEYPRRKNNTINVIQDINVSVIELQVLEDGNDKIGAPDFHE